MKFILTCALIALLFGAVTVCLSLGAPAQWRRRGAAGNIRLLLPLLVLLAVLAADAFGIAQMTPRAKEAVALEPVLASETVPDGAFLHMKDVRIAGVKFVKDFEPSGAWSATRRGSRLDIASREEELPVLNILVPVGTDRALVMETGSEAVQCIVHYGDFAAYADCASPFEGELTIDLPNSPQALLSALRREQLMWFAAILLVMDSCVLLGIRSLRRRRLKGTPAPKRSGSIEFYRFIFCMLVVLYHAQPIAGIKGFLGVEFFFVISGWFLMAHFDRREKAGKVSTAEYALGRVKRIWPYFLFIWILNIIVRYDTFGSTPLPELIGSSIGELLMVQGLGFDTKSGVIIGGWFIGCMIPASVAIYAMVAVSRKRYNGLIGPAITLLVLGWLCLNTETIDQTVWFPGPGGFLTLGFWRAMAEMSIGCWLYDVCTGREKKERSDAARAWSSVTEVCLLSVLVIFAFILGDKCEYDLTALILIVLLVASVMTRGSLLSQFLNSKVSVWLGSLSMAVYLGHGIFILKLRETGLDLHFVPLFIASALISIVFAAVTTPAMDGLMKLLGKARQAFREKLL